MERGEELSVGIPKCRVVVRVQKGNDQPFRGFVFRITAFMQQGRGKEHEVVALNRVRNPLQKVDGIWA